MRHDPDFLGAQGLGGDDSSYQGSNFTEVKAALCSNAYYLTWGGVGASSLPVYEVSLGRILKGVLSRFPGWQFKAATRRAVSSQADMRWGDDLKGFRRLLHPNGLCLFGRWIIDQPNEYSGYFQQGSEALIIARYSTCCTNTKRGSSRSLSMVGKLYPTNDENDSTKYQTANFITQEDLGGEYTEFINDAILRNAPDITPWRRGWGAPILLISGLLFKFVNVEAAVRQLYPIAELNKPKDQSTRCPRFMQLLPSTNSLRIEGEQLDFRDEILAHIYDPEAETPSDRSLVFDIEVADEGRRYGLIKRRWKIDSWRRIGRIEFTDAVASYNSDFVIHFPHPPWRDDPNNPDTLRAIR